MRACRGDAGKVLGTSTRMSQERVHLFFIVFSSLTPPPPPFLIYLFFPFSPFSVFSTKIYLFLDVLFRLPPRFFQTPLL